MKPKHLKLLKVLAEETGWVTATYLSIKINVSIRSIKTYISEINTIEDCLIKSSRYGYNINKKVAYMVLHNNKSPIPQTSEERVNYIIKELVTTTGEAENIPLNIYDLSEEIYVSVPTLKICIAHAKKKLNEYDLFLKTNGNNIILEGLEKNKRKVLCSILYDESDKTLMDINTIQKIFKNYDIEFIQNTIIKIFNKYHYFINDFSLMNLIFHITIAIDRIKNNCIFNTQSVANINLQHNENELAKEIAFELEQKYKIIYNEYECYELALLLISSATTLDYTRLLNSNLENIVGKECFNLVKNIVETVKVLYYIDLNETEFLTKFTLHIKNLLVRSQNNHFSKNPLTENMKSSCPLIYDCAVSISNQIKETTGYSINNDEIAFIALHIGSILENQKSLSNKISCVLLCPQYYDFDIKLADQIKQTFSDSLILKNIITKESDLKLNKQDLILSTINISSYNTIPILTIHPFLTEKDNRNIFNKIDDLKTIKSNTVFKENLKAIFNLDFFYKNKNFSNETEAIIFMTDIMHRSGYISKDFVNEIFEREAMSSTSFNNIAIPHSMKMTSKKTGLFVLINEKPFLWGENHVNIVLLLSININDRKIFSTIFDSITTTLSDEKNVKKILGCNSYEDFITTIVDCN